MRLSRRKYETGIASLTIPNRKNVNGNCQLSRQTDLGVNVNELEELLNEFFDTVVRPDSGQPIQTLPIPSAMMVIPIFTPCLVHEELATLDTSKSPGPAQLHFRRSAIKQLRHMQFRNIGKMSKYVLLLLLPFITVFSSSFW